MFALCRLLIVLAASTALASDGDDGRITGRIFDYSIQDQGAVGAPLPGAIVRLTPVDGGPTLARTRAGRDGYFVLDGVKPGTYAVRMWLQGWREKAVRVDVRQRDPVDVGTVRLDVAFDEPGVMVDCPDPTCGILSSGHVDLRRECTIDLDAGTSACGPETGARKKAGLVLISGEGASLWLRPVNGALMTVPKPGQSDCNGATYANRAIRIDGLGPGNDFCVITGKRRLSHVFFADYVEPDSVQIKLWYGNRRR
jgi:hypothetical protein